MATTVASPPIDRRTATSNRRPARSGHGLLVLAAVIGVSLGACSPLRLLDILQAPQNVERKDDIAYGDRPRQRLDLFQPQATVRDDIIVLFVYGGSWRGGERRDYRFVGQSLAARGLITAVTDYRLFPQARFPTFVEDVAAATAWLHHALPADDGRPRRLVLIGHSAGAHIAALVALDRRYLRSVGLQSDTIAGLVGLAGPYAFDPTTFASTRAIFATAASAEITRPVTFAGPLAPPTLLFHGTVDTTVRPANSRTLAQRLNESGVSARYRELDGVGHIGILLALSPALPSSTEMLDEIVAFVRSLPPRADGEQPARNLASFAPERSEAVRQRP